jgi:hypothetical protein
MEVVLPLSRGREHAQRGRLVYVAAFALDEGESFGEIFAEFGATPLVGAVRPRASQRTLQGGTRRGECLASV